MPDPTILSLGDRHPPPHRRARLQADRRARHRRSPSAATSSRSTSTAPSTSSRTSPSCWPRPTRRWRRSTSTARRLDQVSTRLTALEFEGGATLHDVLTVLQRAELVTRMAVEIERYIVELGTEGRLIEMQLEETMVGVAADKAALVHDYLAEHADDAFAVGARPASRRLPHQDLLDFGRLAELLGYDRKLNTLDYPVSPARLPHPRAHPAAAEARRAADRRASSAGWTRCSPRPTPSSRRSRAWARSVRRTSARAFAGCRRSTSWTATCRHEHARRSRHPAAPLTKEDTIPEAIEEQIEDLEVTREVENIDFEIGDNVVYPHHGAGQGPQEGATRRSSARSASTSRSRSCTTT